MKTQIKGALPVGIILEGKTGTYKIEKALGQGSFGITYQASMRIKGNLGYLPGEIRVAIKEFYMHALNAREESGVVSGSHAETFQNYLGRFQKEAYNLSRMNHPGIVKVLELFEAHQTSYLVMEYLEGGSLDERIRLTQRLNQRDALDIILKVGDSLSYMHSQHMLHLDLKPLNIMLDKTGTPVLIDFGLSKVFDENGIPETSTSVGLGTPGYAPIEQINYDTSKGIAPTLDIYALGGTLFKCLTGKTPPNASAVNDDDEYLSHLMSESHIGMAISDLVVWAMQPRKKDRPQTVADFSARVKEVLDMLPEKDSSLYEDNDESSVYMYEEDYPIDSSVYDMPYNNANDKTIWLSKDGLYQFEKHSSFFYRVQVNLKEDKKRAIQNLLESMRFIEGEPNISYRVMSLDSLRQIIYGIQTDGFIPVETSVDQWCKIIDVIRKETGLPFRFGTKEELDKFREHYLDLHTYPLIQKYFVLEPSTSCFYLYDPYTRLMKPFNLNARQHADILLVCDSCSSPIFELRDYKSVEPFAYCFYLGEKEDGYDILDKDMKVVRSNKMFGYVDSLHWNFPPSGGDEFASDTPLIGNLFYISEDTRESSKLPEVMHVGPFLTLQPGYEPFEVEDTDQFS